MPVRKSLCLFWRETHAKGLSTRSSTRPEVGEGRNVREKAEVSQQKGVEEMSRLKRAVKRKRKTQSTEVSMACGFCGSFAPVHARVSTQNAQKSVTEFPFLRMELTPCLLVCSFLPPSRLCFMCP